jgi:polyisoprenoid-binding protein YceI
VIHRRRVLGSLVILALLAACAPRVLTPPEAEKGAPADFPEAYYRQLRSEEKPVFRVDPARSLVVIEVRRGGTFAQLGHDHVVASHDVTGAIAPDEGRADFYVPLDKLSVDEPALRTRAGFDTQPDAGDIAGTRHNMLTKVLDTERFPFAFIGVNGFGGVTDASDREVRVEMTLHGTTRSIGAFARLLKSPDELTATGTFTIDQSQFGIVPFSILNGAIAVQDRVSVAFDLRFRRAE